MWKKLTQNTWKGSPSVGLTIIIALSLFFCYFMFERERISLSLSVDNDMESEANDAKESVQLPPELRNEMESLNFISIYGNRTLKDFQLEKGGRPLANYIVTTARSGSNFLAEILRSYPATFFEHEPDIFLNRHGGPARCSVGPEVADVRPVFQELYNCNFSCFTRHDQDTVDIGSKKVNKTSFIVSFPKMYNMRLWEACKYDSGLCKNRRFVEKTCRHFPIQLTKLIRVDLAQAVTILADPRMDARILYLVRDPRGTMRSRLNMSGPGLWKKGTPDVLCPQLVRDHKAALEVKAKYPHKFMVVRYEELAFAPFEVVDKILKFLGLEYREEVKLHITSHIDFDEGGYVSTYRDSKTRPFQWLLEAKKDFSMVEELQAVCREAILAWGYKLLKSSKDINDVLNPVKKSQWTMVPLKDRFVDNFVK